MGHTQGKTAGRLLRGLSAIAALSIVAATFVAVLASPAPAAAQTPTAPFAAIQYGTNGCIEVGVRPTAPWNQEKPYRVPITYDRVADGYPPIDYDRALYTQEPNGTNACKYKFQDIAGAAPPATVLGTAYCVQWSAGQRSGTGYDPEPWGGNIPNDGYVRRIIQDFYPATDQPAMDPRIPPASYNAYKSGTVAMAIHYFTDGIILPPGFTAYASVNKQPVYFDLYSVVADIVATAIARGPIDATDAQADPTPRIDGPTTGQPGQLIGPFTIGANASGPVTVTVVGAEAFTDAAATTPFTSGTALPPGAQLWLRSADPTTIELGASALVSQPINTFMVGDPAFKVQSMVLATPVTLLGKSAASLNVLQPPDPPVLSSEVRDTVLESGQRQIDMFTISGLAPGEQGTFTATLYGPEPPQAGTMCSAIVWPTTGVVLQSELVGNSRRAVLTPQIDDPGCYTIGATLDVAPPGLGTALPPGDPLETFLVIPGVVPVSFSVSTQASASEVSSGSQVTDVVTTVLPAGVSVTIVSTLYGPISTDASGTCTNADWGADDLPVHTAFKPVSVSSSGSHTTPAVTLTEPGCYNFGTAVVHQLLTGGETPTPRDLGDATEQVLVRAAVPTPSPSPTSVPASLAATGTDLAWLLYAALPVMLLGAALVTREELGGRVRIRHVRSQVRSGSPQRRCR